MIARRVVPSLLALLAATAALAAAEAPRVTNRNQLPLRAQTSPGRQLASVALYITTDDGASWQRVAQQEADGDDHVRLVFRPPADGRYGFKMVRRFTDGSSDPEPQAGQAPAEKLVAVVDRSAPQIVEHAFTPGEDGAVAITWVTRDPNPLPSPVHVELAPGDRERWVQLGPAQPASGEWQAPVVPPGHRLRLVVTDRAGNRRTSPAWSAPVSEPEAAPAPPPADGESTSPPPADDADEDLARAIADLPDPEAIADEADEIVAATPPEHADAVAVVGDAPAAGAADADGDQSAAAAAAAPEAEADEPSPAPLPDVTELAPLPAIVPPTVAITAPVDPTVAPGVLIGDEAEHALAVARAEVAAGELGAAIALYRRLADSELAATALAEEVLALVANHRRRLAHARIAGAPADARSPRLALIEATLHLHDGEYVRAESATSHIPVDGPLHRRSLWISALALRGQERDEDAAAILRHLATGQDQIAHYARRLLTAR